VVSLGVFFGLREIVHEVSHRVSDLQAEFDGQRAKRVILDEVAAGVPEALGPSR